MAKKVAELMVDVLWRRGVKRAVTVSPATRSTVLLMQFVHRSSSSGFTYATKRSRRLPLARKRTLRQGNFQFARGAADLATYI